MFHRERLMEFRQQTVHHQQVSTVTVRVWVLVLGQPLQT
jgi:hypothetical protein